MKQTLEQILALQDLNAEMDQLRRDARNLEVDLRNQERLLQERQRRAEQAHHERLEAAKRADAVQRRIEEGETELRRLQVQLNTAHSNREFAALQESIASHLADIQKREDQCLSALQEVDELAAEEQRLNQDVQQAEARLQELRDEVAAGQARLACRVDELGRRRDELREQVNPSVLSAYDRLTGHHNGQPLAEVRGRVCQGCFTRITKQTENRLMRGDEIVYCQSCGRMLKLADEQ
jgi:predicted  nucleic acid-binding Zn-ribbon protein